MKKLTESNLRKLIREEIEKINELSSTTIMSALYKAYKEGQRARVDSMVKNYFKQFIGTEIGGGQIAKFGLINMQSEKTFVFGFLIQFRNGSPTHQINYNTDTDAFDGVPKVIDRKDANILWKIAKHINPNTSLKPTNIAKIKGVHD
jgi:hypothetical protein